VLLLLLLVFFSFFFSLFLSVHRTIASDTKRCVSSANIHETSSRSAEGKAPTVSNARDSSDSTAPVESQLNSRVQNVEREREGERERGRERERRRRGKTREDKRTKENTREHRRAKQNKEHMRKERGREEKKRGEEKTLHRSGAAETGGGFCSLPNQTYPRSPWPRSVAAVAAEQRWSRAITSPVGPFFFGVMAVYQRKGQRETHMHHGYKRVRKHKSPRGTAEETGHVHHAHKRALMHKSTQDSRRDRTRAPRTQTRTKAQ
jgi:hypothetical protein